MIYFDVYLRAMQRTGAKEKPGSDRQRQNPHIPRHLSGIYCVWLCQGGKRLKGNEIIIKHSSNNGNIYSYEGKQSSPSSLLMLLCSCTDATIIVYYLDLKAFFLHFAVRDP